MAARQALTYVAELPNGAVDVSSALWPRNTVGLFIIQITDLVGIAVRVAGTGRAALPSSHRAELRVLAVLVTGALGRDTVGLVPADLVQWALLMLHTGNLTCPEVTDLVETAVVVVNALRSELSDAGDTGLTHRIAHRQAI